MGIIHRAKLATTKLLTKSHPLAEPAVVRRKPVDPKGPFDEILRSSLAKDLGSSRIGELKESDYSRKVGMGDVQESEGRRAKAQKYATKMLKAGKGGQGRPRET